MKRHFVLETTEILRLNRQRYEDLKLNAQGLKNTLDCVEQEWRLLYRQLATYTMEHVSIELHRTRENLMSNEEHVSNMRESDRRRGCP